MYAILLESSNCENFNSKTLSNVVASQRYQSLSKHIQKAIANQWSVYIFSTWAVYNSRLINLSPILNLVLHTLLKK